jgi:hypothetical protein
MELTTESVNALVNSHILVKINESINIYNENHPPNQKLSTVTTIPDPELYITLSGRKELTTIHPILLNEIFPYWEIFEKYINPINHVFWFLYLDKDIYTVCSSKIKYSELGNMQNYAIHQEIIADLVKLGNEFMENEAINVENTKKLNREGVFILFLATWRYDLNH